MQSPWKLGPRREILIFLPVALLLLVALSTFALLAHESSLEKLADERRQEASRTAERLAEALAAITDPSQADLARLAPDRQTIPAVGVFVGRETIAFIGDPTVGRLADLGSSAPAKAAWAEGPLAEGKIVARAPIRLALRASELRFEMSAQTLAAQLASARLLARLGLAINAALALLALFALRQLLGPWERLLSRAREISPQGPDDDEVAYLLSTFERATASLAARSAVGAPAEPDLSAIEETLTASLRSGLLLLDRQGDVLALNPIGTELLGFEALNLPPDLPKPLAQVLAPHPQLAAVLSDAVAAVREVQREECVLETAGQERTLGLSVHPMRRANGEVRGFLVLFADLTAAQEKAERGRLAESLAQLGEMAGGIAHELRNGLATLKGYLTLASRKPDTATLDEYLGEMRREADQLERVLSDFLAFAQPGIRPGVDLRTEVDLGALLARAASDPSLGGAAIRLEIEPKLAAWGDEALLTRALRNLLRNALEANGRGGRNEQDEPLVLGARRLENRVEITIDDRGPGVPPEIRSRLFQPFATGRADGVGLGLALAQRIVTLHGGRITLEDRDDRDGGGTRARVDLPAISS